MLASRTTSTYPKDTRDHKLVFVYTVRRKASENKSTNKRSVRKSRKPLLDLPSRTPLDMNGENSAIRMAPYTVDKVPNISFCIVGDYSVVDTLVDISGYMNDRRNKRGHIGVGISANARRHDLGDVSEAREEIFQLSSL